MILIVFTLLAVTQAKLYCEDFIYNEQGCIASTYESCRWNTFQSQCIRVHSKNLGCLSSLNEYSCKQQQFEPEGDVAICRFSGYCKQAEHLDKSYCDPYLSKSACLSITNQGVYCKWENDYCQIQDSVTQVFNENEANPSVCQQILTDESNQEIGVVHSVDFFGLQISLIIDLKCLNIKNKATEIENNDKLSKYEKETLLKLFWSTLNCDTKGLNKYGCTLVISDQKCIWDDTNQKCLLIDHLNDSEQTEILRVAKCSDYLNKNACLSILNEDQPCQWKDDKCQLLEITDEIECKQWKLDDDDETSILVSPSACINVHYQDDAGNSQECFYDPSNYSCNEFCKSKNNKQKDTYCNQSSYHCEFHENTTIFKNINILKQNCNFANYYSQCGILGQNRFSCMQVIDEYCRFSKGQCMQISEEELKTINCEDGLNLYACLSLTNPTQTCQWDSKSLTCNYQLVHQEVKCDKTINEDIYENANSCRFVTYKEFNQSLNSYSNVKCYWIEGLCRKIVNSDPVCETKGLNVWGCLQNSNTISACHWDEYKSHCQVQKVDSEQLCETLKNVNNYACRLIESGEICKYNSSTYNCEKILTSNSCTIEGLNQAGCSSVQGEIPCRWIDAECIEFTADLGANESCQSMLGITKRACQLITYGSEKCKYNQTDKRCTSSIDEDDTCTTDGLNLYGCIGLEKQSCYFDKTNYECQSATSLLNTLTCESHVSKIACIAITTLPQACQWSISDEACVEISFDLNSKCVNYNNNCNPNACRALVVDANSTPEVKGHAQCVYNTTTSQCEQHSGSALTTCGPSELINVHTCVNYSAEADECYFDADSLTCQQLTDNTLLAKINCYQASKIPCLQITTENQNCVWRSSDKTCYSMEVSDEDTCAKFDGTNYIVGPNVCASVTKDGEACKWDSSNSKCLTVSTTTNPCTTPGLNKEACITKTQGACVFDEDKNQCVDFNSTYQQNEEYNCSKAYNMEGCLTSSQQACYWNETDNICESFTFDPSTSLCTDFQDKKYNTYVCGAINNPGQNCSYDFTNFYCGTDLFEFDCLVGFNQQNCDQDWCYFDTQMNQCQDWDSGNDCVLQSNKTDCMAVETENCVWKSGCKKIVIEDDKGCADYQQSGVDYNAKTCSNIFKDGEACALDTSGAEQKCVTVSSQDKACTADGLNRLACLLQTNQDCGWSNDDEKCETITDFDTDCTSETHEYNAYTCSKITGKACHFLFSTQQCQNYSGDLDCNNHINNTVEFVTQLVCTQMNDTSSCGYNATNRICEIRSVKLDTCTEDQTLNKAACKTLVNDVCNFNSDEICDDVNDDYLSEITCADALNYHTCVQIKKENQFCHWDGSVCNSISPQNTECTNFTDVNPNSCMIAGTANQECQFVDNTTTTQCVVPVADTNECWGLNEEACIVSINSPCYFDDTLLQCQEVDQTRSVYCSDKVNYLGCLFTRTEGCTFSGGNCQSLTYDEQNDGCLTNNVVLSPFVCASLVKAGEFCKYDEGTNNCVDASGDSGLSCDALGLNIHTCSQKTTGQCGFFEDQCRSIDSNNQNNFDCSSSLNQDGCLFISKKCVWNIGSRQCSTQTVSGTDNCSNFSGDNNLKYNKQVCMNVINSGQACIISGTNQCEQASGSSYSCSQDGLNKLACLSNTSGYCKWDGDKNECLTIADMNILEQVANCQQIINKNACLFIQNLCCQWNSSSSECEDGSVSGSETCTNLNSNSKSWGCCSRVSSSDQYCILEGQQCINNTTNNTQFEDCATDSLPNKLTCLKYTESDCEWDQSNYKCDYSNNTGNCRDTLNKSGCFSLYNPDSTLCIFANTCQSYTIDANTECADLQKVNNPNICKSISAKPCYFEYDLGCKQVDQNAYCTSEGLGELGCKYNIQSCSWNGSTCTNIDVYSANLSSCDAQIISIGACAQLDSLSCRFDLTTNQCIALVIPTDFDNISCNYFTGISQQKAYLCSLITTGSCAYNLNSCVDPSTFTVSGCSGNYANQNGCRDIQGSYCQFNKDMQEQDQSQGYTNNSDYCMDLDTAYNQNCEQIFNKWGCLNYISLPCYWDSDNDQCKQYSSQDLQSCDDMPSLVNKHLCQNYSSEQCRWDQTAYTCTAYTESNTICSSIQSSRGCQQKSNCRFNILTLECEDYTYQQNSSTCSELRFSSESNCVQLLTKFQYCQYSNDSCIIPQMNQINCTDKLNKWACIKVSTKDQYCKWDQTNNKCADADINTVSCEDDINIHTCLNVTTDNQYCIWLSGACRNADLDKHEFFDINANSCRLLEDDWYIYDPNQRKCVEVQDFESLQCDTPGLNQLSCLFVIQESCQWLADKCQTFTLPSVISACADLSNVSPGACASITTSDLKCRYNIETSSCEDSVPSEEICEKFVINKEACINIDTMPCHWKDNRCQEQEVIAGITSCISIEGESLVQVVSEDSNPLSCAAVDFRGQTCKYNQQTKKCDLSFNSHIDQCTTPGINEASCASVTYQHQACIFDLDRCKVFEPDEEAEIYCSQLIKVNANSCELALDNCKFQKIEHKCVGITSVETCEVQGLNQIGCEYLKESSSCQWNGDFQQCQCNQMISKDYEQCNLIIDQPQCDSKTYCIYSTDKCVRKTCQFYTTKDECIATNQNHTGYEKCYWKNDNTCGGANECDDLINLASGYSCSGFTLNDQQCEDDSEIANHCTRLHCGHISQNDCNSKQIGELSCIWKDNECQLKECSDLSEDSCNGSYQNYKSCYWIKDACQGLTLCQQVTDETICSDVSIENKKCVWQNINQFSNVKECTDRVCKYPQLRGESYDNCQGAEYLNEVCVLRIDLNCISCEEISDPCQCLEYDGFCQYNQEDQKCVSIPCSTFTEETICQSEQNYERCKWSKQGICVVQCIKRNQEECTVGENEDCYWSDQLGECIGGQKEKININTLEGYGIVSTQYGEVLVVTIMIIIQMIL